MPKGYIRWGQRQLEDDVWTLALDRTRRAFETFDHVLVSFSAGKDSTVVLNAALEVAEELGRLPIRVIHFDEEAIPYETEDYTRRVSRDPRVSFEWYCLPVQHRNACSRDAPHWWPWAPESRDLWCRPLPPEAITELEGFPMEPAEARPSLPMSCGLLAPASRYGSCGMLMGIRADESLTRRKAVGNDRAENWVIPAPQIGANMFKVYPIYDMVTADVWTAPARFGWDYNHSYDLMEMIGIPHPAQRCAPPYGEQPMQKLWVFKECFPDLWERMLARVPGAATAARYATTELYAFNSIPEKPPELTWQDFIKRRISEYEDPVAKRWIAYRVRKFITLHYKKTAEPLLSVPHPDSGVSWAWLYKIADRGDLKERSWPDYNSDRAAYEAAWSIEHPETFPGFTALMG